MVRWYTRNRVPYRPTTKIYGGSKLHILHGANFNCLFYKIYELLSAYHKTKPGLIVSQQADLFTVTTLLVICKKLYCLCPFILISKVPLFFSAQCFLFLTD